jgi:hypothetical protein
MERQKEKAKLGTVSDTYNPSTQEAEIERIMV